MLPELLITLHLMFLYVLPNFDIYYVALRQPLPVFDVATVVLIFDVTYCLCLIFDEVF